MACLCLSGGKEPRVLRDYDMFHRLVEDVPTCDAGCMADLESDFIDSVFLTRPKVWILAEPRNSVTLKPSIFASQ